MNLKQLYEQEIAKAEAEVAKLKAELESIPEEVRAKELSVMERIKGFFEGMKL